MAILVKNTKTHPSGRVEYRRAIPPALRPFVSRPDGKPGKGPREFKRSLGEEGSPGFLSRYEAAANEFDALVSLARREQAGDFDRLDAPTIAYLAEAFRVHWLAEDERRRWDEGPDFAARVDEGLLWELDEWKRWAGEGDREAIEERWGDEARGLLSAAGKLVDPQDDDGFGRLCYAINAAAIRTSIDLEARLAGDPAPTPQMPSLPQATKSVPPAVRLPILATYDAYASEAGLSPGVRQEWRAYFAKLVGFLGHDDAGRITADDVVAWKDHLLAEPSRSGAARSPVTVNDKYLTSLKAMLQWAVDQRKLAANVAKGIRARVPKKRKLRERDFTADEARRILAASLEPASLRLSEGYRRARRWVPWLCTYSGARVNEMSQLRAEDVQTVEGVAVLRITPEAGTTKTQEARVVPIHPHLIEQGFLDAVAGWGDGPLFYDPARRRTDGSNRHFKKVGERLAEWVRLDVGITDPGIKPNHAWRHTFKTLAVAAGVPDRVSDAITGHAAKSVGAGYGTVPLRAKLEAIRSLPRWTIPGGPA